MCSARGLLPLQGPWGRGADQTEIPPDSTLTRELEGFLKRRPGLEGESAEVCCGAPGRQGDLAQWLALARSQFLGAHLLVGQGGGFALIAEGNDGAGD